MDWSTVFQRFRKKWFLTSFTKDAYEYCLAQPKNRFISSTKSSLSLKLLIDFSLQTPIMYLAISLVHSSSGNISEIIFKTCFTMKQFLTFHSLFLTSLIFCVLNLFLIYLRMVLMLDFRATSFRFCLESELMNWLYGVLIHCQCIPGSRAFRSCFQRYTSLRYLNRFNLLIWSWFTF